MTPSGGRSVQPSGPVAERVGSLLEEAAGGREGLARVAAFLRQAMAADVCSIYRVAPKSGDLWLEATDGLSLDRVGRVALRSGEGLTGLVVRTRRPLPVRDGPSHPNFRYIPGMGEEDFHSFLGVPIVAQGKTLGALVVQTKDPRDFGRAEIALLTTAARRVAPAAAGIFAALAAAPAPAAPVVEGRRVVGRSLSPGCYAGRPLALDHSMRVETVVTPRSRGVEEEIKALRQANRRVRQDLAREAQAISGTEGQAVLVAHKILLEDDSLARECIAWIEKGESAAEAVRQTALRWIPRLENLPDPSFAARATDFRDIANRLLGALGVEAAAPKVGRRKVVGVAHGMLPGDLLRLGKEKLGALILTDQGVYSHTAILARSFDIPTVQVDPARLDEVAYAKTVLVDGTEGIVFLDPSPELCATVVERAASLVAIPEGGPRDLTGGVFLTDGAEVRVSMNAGLLPEFEGVDRLGPADVGLYRSEIPFMSRATLPGPRTQAAHYRKVLALAGGRRVCFRTFDFGGDKIPKAISFDHEDNPLMGYRSTRYMLDHPEVLRTQIRALLTVSAEGPLSILAPMISTPEELNLFLDEVNAVKNRLEQEGVAFDPETPVGAMIEVPSAMFLLDELSRLADFFCVGGNDLIQYLMAADRSNHRVSRLYQWHHPAVLVAMERILRHCRRNGRPVTFCGEMASHPWAAMILVGMGYERLSVDRHAIPIVKWTLMQCSGERLREFAARVMRATSSAEVIELLHTELERIRKANPVLGRSLREPLNRLRENAVW